MDGLVTIVPKNRVNLYKSIISDFEQEYEFEGEYNQYEWYIRKDVNNYIAKQIDGKFKYKGIFDYKIYLEKGYKYPIINYVLKEYYENEQTKSVKDIVLSNNDIYDFCVCQKAKKTFTMYYGDDAIQSSTRAYVSLNGKPIVKKQPVVSKKTGETRISTTTLLKNKVFTLFNDYFEVNKFEDYQIDYDYYIGECQKIIDKITKNYNNGR